MNELARLLILFYCTIYTSVRAHSEKCGSIHGHRVRRHDHEVFPSRPPTGNKYGFALEFETGQVIQYPKQRNPSKIFSVDFWMRPEGGQQNPAVVLHAYDKCAPDNEARGWFIGLREATLGSDLRISFTVHSASAQRKQTIMSHQKIEPRRWYHVAATYDGIQMKLYVNQAEVAVGYEQKGIIFDSTTQNHACDHLEVGGDVKRGLFYRGQIDKLRLWSEAIPHRALTQTLPENTIDNEMEKIAMYDDYNDINIKNAKFVPVTDQFPRFVRSTVPEDKHDVSIRKPPCGKTICDNPEVVKSYLKHPDSRGTKHLNIRFINVMDDDGGRPTLTDSEINSQFELLQRTFSRYNITWQKTVKSIRNSSLRSKTILHNAHGMSFLSIGDGNCHDSFNLEITGWDGGDCKRTECPPEKKGNGVCDPECNSASYKYDWGECCTSRLSTLCIDPESPNCRYVSANDYRKYISISNQDALNVYVVNWTDENLLGLSTFPWEKEVHTELGGIVVPPKNFATTKALIHEIGHILGLWHVHYGSVSGDMSCTDDCFESFSSMELGDLCSDTNPTIKHTGTTCGDPVVTLEQSCGLPQYTNTPYDNYMSYADDSCTNHFTQQQVARMHCYIDLDYQSWQMNAKPSFVPLPPQIIEADDNRIKLSWLPPFGPGGDNAINLCNECEDQQMLEQYAATAFSPTSNIQRRDSNEPYQATGPPDGGHCNPSKKAWQPPEDLYIRNPNIQLYLQVGFKQAVVPKEITIWVSYTDPTRNAFSDIVLVYTDGSTQSVGNGTAQCDTPFTKKLYVEKKVASVKIYVSHFSVCIDAVKLTSGIGHPNCSNCKSLRYVVRREPPFDTGHEITVANARFEDNNVDTRGRYEYKVQAITYEGVAGPFSPPLIYEASRGFCGDGKIDEGENCDDGNVRDGDGCNIQCQMEDVFHCNDRPSLCYRHDGDGVCETFEKRTSIKDCGFYTPEGFKDQWVSRATANPKYNYSCTTEGIVGAPRRDLNCESDNYEVHVTCGDGWTPSNNQEDIKPYGSNFAKQNLWINVYFKNPTITAALVVYLASIIPSNLDFTLPRIEFELHGRMPSEKTTLEHKLSKVCKENPIIIPIYHDMTKPFFKTHYVKIIFDTDVKIAAVALRSPKNFDPVGLQHCTGSQLFHPSTQKCQDYECNMPQCPRFILKHSREIKSCVKGSLEGTTCRVACNKGYEPITPFDVMCSGGEWLVDNETPQCTPVNCGEPKIQNADIHCPDGHTFGKKCIYRCKQGTKPTDPGTELSVTCEADGLWSAITTFCHKTCRPPPIPRYSRLLASSKNCNKGKPFAPGESCKYRCKSGYRPSGHFQKEMYRNGDFVQRCLKGGTWTKKRCIPVRCPIHDSKISRWYNCTQGNKFGSVCRLPCPGEKAREVQCGADGKWDKPFQFCSTKGTCPAPENPNTELTVISCGENRTPGDECQITCGEGLRPIVEGDGLSQERNSITCSPYLQWYPVLSEIRCVVRCMQSVGDNYCDEENNNEDCNYDGGDCCNPDVCLNGCDCRDVTSPHYGSGDDRSSS